MYFYYSLGSEVSKYLDFYDSTKVDNIFLNYINVYKKATGEIHLRFRFYKGDKLLILTVYFSNAQLQLATCGFLF